ncbi:MULTISPECIES: hypothetical protein [unclassified Campylobacter]|uniref:hypothetical protein n=1 Tax=unclassified Campylobacter TaxID=2593542 RepID=UPI00115E64F6|nr:MULTISPECIES: hypothetical protein [unclassified Campylobacter]NDJ26888.1 hypothetical protein [Campylobacter sp. MIT 19-121]
MTQRDLAGRLDINVKTLRKWKKDRPRVYELLMLGLEAENMLKELQQNVQKFEELLYKHSEEATKQKS